MTSGRSLEQRARLSRESGLDLNRFDSVRHLGGSLGTRPNARLYEYVILSELTAVSQFTNLPIYRVTRNSPRPLSPEQALFWARARGSGYGAVYETALAPYSIDHGTSHAQCRGAWEEWLHAPAWPSVAIAM